MNSGSRADQTTDRTPEFERLLLVPGTDLGVSDWMEIPQTMISGFGEVTQDPDPMHMDADWVRLNTPYDRPIAYGFLTLSLISPMFARLMKIPSASQAPVSGHFLNYGFNRVRFVAPVPAGSRLRGHFRTADEQPGSDKGETIVAVDVLVELEGADRPALVAQWLAAWVRD